MKIASIGTWSGPVGSVVTPNLQALQVWVRWINDRGGLNGHLVDLVVGDDGGDPARHRALKQEMIERRKVIAFVQDSETMGGKASVDYVTAHGVPVIGGDTGEQHFYESPMYFPQASSGYNLLSSVLPSMASRTVAKGLVKLGTLTCQEANVCRDADRIWNGDEARAAGFEPVFRQQVSLAQPDFTAQCLAASSRGVQIMLIALDSPSLPRFAAACARQNYHPVIGTASSIAVAYHAADLNLQGLLVTAPTFPWFATGTPAIDEFHAAMQTYAPRVPIGAGHSAGWVSAKLFELAGAHMPEPPTSAAVLEGLWAMREVTLGGLTQPLTFTRNKPAPQVVCWFDVSVQGRAWTADGDFRVPQCQRSPQS